MKTFGSKKNFSQNYNYMYQTISPKYGFIIYYSNFDEHHYKDFHRNQCTEPTTLALYNFLHDSSNSTNVSVLIENAVGYNF